MAGNNVYNVARATMDRTDDPSNHRAGFTPWTPDNHSTTTPRALANNGVGVGPDQATRDRVAGDLQQASAQNSQPSSRFLEKGDYLRGKNVQIGYTFPKTFTERVKGISSLRLYVTGQNFFTATKYLGPDPEFNNASDNAFRARHRLQFLPQLAHLHRGHPTRVLSQICFFIRNVISL